jgi:hypothetical protein
MLIDGTAKTVRLTHVNVCIVRYRRPHFSLQGAEGSVVGCAPLTGGRRNGFSWSPQGHIRECYSQLCCWAREAPEAAYCVHARKYFHPAYRS